MIDNVVRKLFGHNRNNHEVGTNEYLKQEIKNAPDTIGKYYEYTADKAIKDFLFEQTDIAKELKKIMDKVKYDNPQEENT